MWRADFYPPALFFHAWTSSPQWSVCSAVNWFSRDIILRRCSARWLKMHGKPFLWGLVAQKWFCNYAWQCMSFLSRLNRSALCQRSIQITYKFNMKKRYKYLQLGELNYIFFAIYYNFFRQQFCISVTGNLCLFPSYTPIFDGVLLGHIWGIGFLNCFIFHF